MIYLVISAFSAFLGLSGGLGATTLLRPMLDAVSPLSQSSLALLCTTIVESSLVLLENVCYDQCVLLVKLC